MQELKEQLSAVVRAEFGEKIELELNRPEEKFGDYATNVALQLGKKLGKNPKEIAILLAAKFHKQENIADVQIAGPGFINIILKDDYLLKTVDSAAKLPKPLAGKEILTEFGDPNPFKPMHIGHLYSYVVGESIARLLEAAGAKVIRLSYHGDVGLHVAKALWSLQKSGDVPAEIPDKPIPDIGQYYQKGAQAYEEDEQAKNEINDINDRIYKKDDPELNKLYEWGKNKSFAEFETVLQDLRVRIDKQYMESESASAGIDMVKDNSGKVFQSSDGAIVYRGEKVDLHTRVFLTSRGLPTYETKDLGLAKLKDSDYPKADRSIIITAHEQAEYFKVMLAALAEIKPALADKTTHLYHGFVNLSSGKMSSRKGDVYTAISLMTDVLMEVNKAFGSDNVDIEMGAIKYEFLKHRLGSDITYDPEASVSLQGNSGPYIQYAHARARAVIAKAGSEKSEADIKLEPAERSLARKISEYPEVVARARDEFLPSHVTTYLYELTQKFNSFYEKNRIIGDSRQGTRLYLTKKYADVLKDGLTLLNIEAPQRV